MRAIIVALIAVSVAIAAGTIESAAEENCSIRDSALCLANKNCHWDGEKRGCEPGPAPYVDPCSSHEAEAICASDDTLGCKWTAEAKKCESKVKPSSAN
jgi:hypothetical protein